MGRFIIELGMGADLHGQDVTKAAKKAVEDAISMSCLCGLREVLGIGNLNDGVYVHVTVAVSRPDEVDCDAVRRLLPVGTVDVEAVQGGLRVPGLYVSRFKDADNSIEVAVAAVEVEVH